MSATIQRFPATTEPARLLAALDRDGVVIVEGLLPPGVVARVNAEVEEAVAAADPSAPLFNPILQAFHGSNTRQVSGVARISPTFATEVICHPVLLAVCDEVLGPSCARYQLNIGHLLERGPGTEAQWLHRDELVWSDVPRPHPELQLASVIAFVDFTEDNGATRVVPGSHRWPDRGLSPAEQLAEPPPGPEQVACAEMSAGDAVVYTGGVIHGGGANVTDVPRRGAHLSYCLGWLRTEENNYLAVPPAVAATLPRQAQELLGYAIYDNMARGGGYLGMVDTQDPVELLARGELWAPWRVCGCAGPVVSEWHRTFFDRTANDFWNAAVTTDQTEREVEFLVAALELGYGSRVVDVPAGRGRLTLPLAERVRLVVAVDYSSDGIQWLRRAAGPGVAVLRADMRELPVSTGFDACCCMGNSFGYFNVDGVERFLADVARLLRVGGRFVVESATVREALSAGLAEETSHTFGGVTVRGQHHLEGDWLVSRLEVDDGPTRALHTIRQLALPSERIAELVEGAGLRIVGMLGGTGGEAFDASAPSLLLIAERGA